MTYPSTPPTIQAAPTNSATPWGLISAVCFSLAFSFGACLAGARSAALSPPPERGSVSRSRRDALANSPLRPYLSPLMEKVVIIGTGCAGLTAALYTARANLNPLVLTGTLPGGLLTTTSIVENYPGFPEGIDGYELMTRMQKQAERFGARVKFATVEAVDLVTRPFRLNVDGDPVESESLIIATGA